MATNDEFVESILAVTRGGADFLVVGVSGVNFYANDASESVITHHLDLWLRPDAANVSKALIALRDAGFFFEAGGEPFVDLEDELVLGNVIRFGGTIVARKPPEVGRLDLMLSLFDFSFADEREKAAEFHFEGRLVRVADLETLLRSKERAGREKDLIFLQLHGARFRELAKARRPSKPKRARKKAKPRKRR